jgi:hypothetical protein
VEGWRYVRRPRDARAERDGRASMERVETYGGLAEKVLLDIGVADHFVGLP